MAERRCLARRIGGLVVAGALVVLAPAHAGAQTIANAERQLLPFKGGLLDGVPADFWNGLARLRKEEEQLRAIKGEITFGLSGDEAGPQSLFKMNTGISLKRDVYPSEISVVSKLGLQLKDGQLQEDVTTLRITYDYHPSPHVETFTFAERFTDSFLSIQQRYEIGVGARLGASFGRMGNAKELKEIDDSLAAVDSGRLTAKDAMGRLAATRLAGLTRVSADDFDDLGKVVTRLRRALADEQTRLFVGMAASVFAELERAEIEATSTPVAGGASTTAKIATDAEQRYRLSLRPTIKYRPAPTVEVAIYPYFKLPLDGPTRRTVNGQRRLDYRRDILTETTWALKPEQTGLETVALVLTINHFMDNVPPSISPAAIDAALASGTILTNTLAVRSHRVVVLSLKLGW